MVFWSHDDLDQTRGSCANARVMRADLAVIKAAPVEVDLAEVNADGAAQATKPCAPTWRRKDALAARTDVNGVKAAIGG
jgi:hypothetical protein